MTERLVHLTMASLTALPLAVWLQPPWYASLTLVLVLFQMYGLTYTLNVMLKSQALVLMLLTEAWEEHAKQSKRNPK